MEKKIDDGYENFVNLVESFRKSSRAKKIADAMLAEKMLAEKRRTENGDNK